MTLDVSSVNGVYLVHNFLDGPEVQFWQQNMTDPRFWEGSFIQDGIEAVRSDSADIMSNFAMAVEEEAVLIDRVRGLIHAHFGEDVSTDTGSFFERSVPGFWMGKHHDHLRPDGSLDFDSNGDSLPRACIEFASLIYFNEDFTGGELVFPNFELSIHPEAGMLVIFPATDKYSHSVNAVTGGSPRLRISHFWTRIRTLRIAAHATVFEETIRNTMRYLDAIFPEDNNGQAR